MSEASTIAKSAAQKRAQRCRFFNGVQHDKCEAGVCYKDLEKDGNRLPCLPWHNHPNATGTAHCDKFAVFTGSEIQQQERDIESHLLKMDKVMELVAPMREEARRTKQSLYRKFDCPGCGGKETLCVAITNYNYHMRGNCPGCDVGWIE